MTRWTSWEARRGKQFSAWAFITSKLEKLIVVVPISSATARDSKKGGVLCGELLYGRRRHYHAHIRLSQQIRQTCKTRERLNKNLRRRREEGRVHKVWRDAHFWAAKGWKPQSWRRPRQNRGGFTKKWLGVVVLLTPPKGITANFTLHTGWETSWWKSRRVRRHNNTMRPV